MPPHVPTLLAQVQRLLQENMFSSAETLVGIVLSVTGRGVDDVAYAHALLLMGDAVFGAGEARRAIKYFQEALDRRTRLRGDVDAGFTAAEARRRIARGYVQLNQPREASTTLENIPSKDRSAADYVALGNFMVEANNERPAINMFKEALRLNPYAIDAAVALVTLGVTAHDVVTIVVGAGDREAFDWLVHICEAHAQSATNEHRAALAAFVALDDALPNNLDVMINLAYTKSMCSDSGGAIDLLRTVHEQDECMVAHMDYYAELLYLAKDAATLNRLANDLMGVDRARPEPWVAMAQLALLNKQKDRALAFVDKAIDINDRHLNAHLTKGNIFITFGMVDASITAFRRAYTIKRTLAVFTGLVEAYLKEPRYKDALMIAKEALQLMPRNPLALTLVGSVLTINSDGREKARKAFTNALFVDNKCFDAVLALVQLNILEHRHQDAIDLLQQYLNASNAEMVHTKLGDVYALDNKYREALQHYTSALSLNPQSDHAKRGVERLEKLTKGLNPDLEVSESSAEGGETFMG